MQTSSWLLILFVLIFIVAILCSLGLGGFYLIKDQGRTKRLAKILRLRIILSFLLLFGLLFAFLMGWIMPHGPFG